MVPTHETHYLYHINLNRTFGEGVDNYGIEQSNIWKSPEVYDIECIRFS
jgi:hypothetical protein